MPTDEQLTWLITNALPPGTITDSSREGEQVTAAGQAARIMGADATAQLYCAWLDELGFLSYGSFAPSQVT